MNDNNETVILNDLSRFGLRRVHVIRMGKPVVRNNWVHLLPVEIDWRDLTVIEYREETLDVHHLWFHWHAREFVQLRFGNGQPSEPSCWWWLGDLPVRLAADCAATVYRRRTGAWPERVLIQQLPGGATADSKIEASDRGETVCLPLVVADWVPPKIVIVSGRSAGGQNVG